MSTPCYHCPICDAIYEGKPFAGYCDETIDCATDEGDSLIEISHEQMESMLAEYILSLEEGN